MCNCRGATIATYSGYTRLSVPEAMLTIHVFQHETVEAPPSGPIPLIVHVFQHETVEAPPSRPIPRCTRLFIPEAMFIVHVFQHETVDAPPSGPILLTAEAEDSLLQLAGLSPIVARVAGVPVEMEDGLANTRTNYRDTKEI